MKTNKIITWIAVIAIAGSMLGLPYFFVQLEKRKVAVIREKVQCLRDSIKLKDAEICRCHDMDARIQGYIQQHQRNCIAAPGRDLMMENSYDTSYEWER